MTTVHGILKVVNYAADFRIEDMSGTRTFASGSVRNFYEHPVYDNKLRREFGGKMVHNVEIGRNIIIIQIEEE